MATQLVENYFRYSSGIVAKFVPVQVRARGTATVLASLTTDAVGHVALYLNPGSYDWYIPSTDYTDPFDVVVQGGLTPIKYRGTAATWTITHDRGTKPEVILTTDADGNYRVFTDVSYPDDSTIVVEWPAPTAGWAYIQ